MREARTESTAADGGVHLSLIVPAYRSASYLERSLERAARWLAAKEQDTELLVVDDGSPDDTFDVARRFAASHGPGKPRIRVLRNAQNRGKGFSVRRGMLAAAGRFRLFTDADLTYPIEGADLLVAALEDGYDLAVGSRVHPDSIYEVPATFLRYIFTRHVAGRIFNLVVRSLVVPGILDTQAGIKGMTAAAARNVFPRVRSFGFSFDVEMLFIARRLGLRTAQVPVRFLYNKEPSTVHFLRDSLRMLVDMARIRWRGLSGAYDRAPSPDEILQDPVCLPESGGPKSSA